MNDGELTWVSNHLGISKNVHKKWYRQEESTIELTKVAKLLIAKHGGVSFREKISDLPIGRMMLISLDTIIFFKST